MSESVIDGVDMRCWAGGMVGGRLSFPVNGVRLWLDFVQGLACFRELGLRVFKV